MKKFTLKTLLTMEYDVGVCLDNLAQNGTPRLALVNTEIGN